MITEKEYLEAKKIIEAYESEQLNKHAVIDSDERAELSDDKWVTDYCHDHTPYWGVCSTCGRY